LDGVRTRASDGVVLDQTRKRLVATKVFYGSAPSLVFDGQNFLVVWTNTGELLATHVRPDGTVVEATPLVLRSGPVMSMSTVPLAGENCLIVWRDQTGAQEDIHGARSRTSDGMMVGSPVTIAAQPTAERVPAVAYDGTNFLVVWEDERSPPGIFGNR